MITRSRWSTAAARVGAVLLISLWSSASLAEQIVVLDETWVHGPDMPDSHYRVAPAAGTPSSWVSPTDYSQGTAYVYLEVHTKPTDQPTRFQVCFEATPTYACTAQSPTYTETGVYEWATSFSDFWSPPGESVDWAQGVNKIACILKDTMNNKPSADNVGPDTAALYMPTEVRMVVTVVEPGGTYKPPTPTGAGGGGNGGSGGAGDTGGTEDTRGAGAGASSGGGDSGGPGGAGGGGAGGGSPAANDGDGGCSFTPRSSGAVAAWLALAAAALAFGRRRRR